MRQAPPPEHQRLDELAQGYALGELADEDLRELHELLQDEKLGATCAAATWAALRDRAVLRASLDPHFTPQVADRIAHAADPAQDRGFLAGILAGIGLQRPRLDSVRIKRFAPQRRRRGGLLALLGALLVLGLWWFGMRSDTPVRITALSGYCVQDGLVRDTGGVLAPGTLAMLAEGGRLELAWRTGAQALIHGPATFSCARGQLSILSGQLRLRSAPDDDFHVGLATAGLRLAPASDCTIESDEQGLLVGVDQGLVDFRHRDLQLVSGQCSAGHTMGRWVDETGWTDHIPAHSADAWWCSFTLQLADNQAALSLKRGDTTLLTFRSSGLRSQDGAIDIDFEGPPRRQRVCQLSARAGRISLDIDGHIITSALSGAPPDRLTTSGRARISASRFRTGPRPLPWPADPQSLGVARP